MCNEMHCNSDSTTDKKDNVRSSSWDPLQWYCHPKRYVHHFQSIYQKRYMQYIIHIYRICNDRLYHEIFGMKKDRKFPPRILFARATIAMPLTCGLAGVGWWVGSVGQWGWLIGWLVTKLTAMAWFTASFSFSAFPGMLAPHLPTCPGRLALAPELAASCAFCDQCGSQRGVLGRMKTHFGDCDSCEIFAVKIFGNLATFGT